MIDEYKHLNERDFDGVVVGIEEIAQQVEQMSYGMYRMVSALVRRRLAHRPNDKLALAIKGLLDAGMY